MIKITSKNIGEVLGKNPQAVQKAMKRKGLDIKGFEDVLKYIFEVQDKKQICQK